MELLLTGGAARGRKLRTLNNSRQVRPTSGKVREALFSIIGPAINNSRFLDLYAGYGTVGFEAASRGSSWVGMVEFNPQVFKVLKLNSSRLALPEVQLFKRDASRMVLKKEYYDFIFLDPPFDLDFNSLAGPLRRWRASCGTLIAQFHSRSAPEWISDADLVKKYGESSLGIFYNLSP